MIARPERRPPLRAPARHVVAASLLLVLAGCGKKEAPPPPPPAKVGVVTLKEEPATLTVELPGRVAAVETSEVRPQVNGVVRERRFEQGSRVAKGDVLFVIEDAPYRAAVLQARGAVARAQAAIQSTRLQAQRYGELVGINAVSRQEVDNARASAGQATADVTSARGQLQSALVNLGFTRIRAPISGRIGRSLFTVGALVQTGQADALATIQRTDRVYVDVPQSAAELTRLRGEIRAGGVSRGGPDSVAVRVVLPDGTPYAREGRFNFSEVTVDPTTGAVTLRATFPNPDGLLLPGMFVRARLVEGVRRAAILAPQIGIQRNERGDPTALVVGRDNVVQQRTVTVDRAVGDAWIVTSGLKAGDRLVVEGVDAAKPGTKVQPGAPRVIGRPSAPAGPDAKPIGE